MSLSCSQQNWGGYPFRVEMTCDSAQISRIADGTDIVLASQNITSLTQIYNPRHVITRFTGPTTIDIHGSAGASMSVQATHDPALMSFVFSEKTPARVSLLIENLSGTLATAQNPKPASVTAKSLNLHGRFTEPPADGQVSYDFAATAKDIAYDGPVRDPIDDGPIIFDTFAIAGEVGRFAFPWPKRLDETLKSWAENDGELRITQFDVTRAPVRASMKGSLKSDSKGRLNGKLSTKIINLDKFLDRMASVGKLTKGQAGMAKSVFRLLSGNKDNAAVSTELVLKDSNIYFGPFRVGQLAPLF